jgi:hypothetical protein
MKNRTEKEVREFRVSKDYCGIKKGEEVKSNNPITQRKMIKKGLWIDEKGAAIEEQRKVDELERVRLEEETIETARLKDIEDKEVREDNVRLKSELEGKVKEVDGLKEKITTDTIKMKADIDKEKAKTVKAEGNEKAAIKRAEKAEKEATKNKAIGNALDNK